MIVPSPVELAYSSVRPHLEALQKLVRDTLHSYADPRGYAVISRVKKLESVAEKIESGRFAAWSDIDDLVACAIVVPSLLEEADALAFLESVFEQVGLRRR